ncbi:putative metal-dependent peptidase [Azospirillum agricola]|uniref:vWA domain-containing protein n=1 Tax=Azospirillum agricola TaxID=1720247 RepID=UPI001AE34C8B|nr:hypothetical protein [Azospirillum agricola]MBP2230408.1 putative metal-dependent peptidase [Azospirillum agricola]
MGKRRDTDRTISDPATLAFRDGVALLAGHPLTAPLLHAAHLIRGKDRPWPYGATAWCVVTPAGDIICNPARRGTPQEWARAVAHALLHLGMEHFQDKANPRLWNAACDVVVCRLLDGFGIRSDSGGDAAGEAVDPALVPDAGEAELYGWMVAQGCPDSVWALGTAGPHPDMVDAPVERWRGKVRWADLFVDGMREAVRRAVAVAGGRILQLDAKTERVSAAEEARRWFTDRFPLLGAIAAAFRIVEDPVACRSLDVSVAAVSDMAGEIYVNPAHGLSPDELRFVMAHELLHAALRHLARRRGRDAFLWNVACDYVVNGWLLEMAVGAMPAGLLHDPQLKGMSAETVYDRLCGDLRRARKLATLRGAGLCDMLEERRGGPPPSSGDWTDLDAFYRRALMDGLELHRERGRGTIPAGLIEEIRALAHPPLEWDVELARWFDERFSPIETVRSFARPSRRQAGTPDIPRPSRRPALGSVEDRSFGVLLDSSGSMDRILLGKALGAIASYATAKDVRHVRVVFCDAAAYDQGYLDVVEIASRLTVRGRGGTVLQPGIDLLEDAEDFPKDAPLLIITDGECDRLTIRRDHALLIPAGRPLPFAPRGPVFRVR